jgi:hypothetical protein
MADLRRTGCIGQLTLADQPTLQCITQGSIQMLLAQWAAGYIQQGA